MGKYAQLVLGPAGCGKSTYCYFMQQHLRLCKRLVDVINLDPAAEEFRYHPSLNIYDLIYVEKVMKEKKLGPNGSLVYCMEYMMDHEDWLCEYLEGFGDDYLLFDLPGQIELYTHLPTIKRFASLLESFNYRVCVLFLLDAHFITDASKFISASLASLSVMIHLEMPHLNVLTKCDLLDGKKGLDVFLDLDTRSLKYMLDSEALQSQAILDGALSGNPSSFHFSSSTSHLSSSTSSSSQYLTSSLSTNISRRLKNPFSDPDMEADEIQAVLSERGTAGKGRGNKSLKDENVESRNSLSSSSSSSFFSSFPTPSSLTPTQHSPLHRLNMLLCDILNDFNLVSFVPLDITCGDSLEKLMLMIDQAVQYGEDEEPKEPPDFSNEN